MTLFLRMAMVLIGLFQGSGLAEVLSHARSNEGLLQHTNDDSNAASRSQNDTGIICLYLSFDLFGEI